MEISPTDLATSFTAIGALGTAAFGLVDVTKVFWGGPSLFGFGYIARLIDDLGPDGIRKSKNSAISKTAIIETLKANWINGVSPSDLKSTTKTLIKLRLNPSTASAMALTTGVPPQILEAVANKLDTGSELTPDELNVYGRFDLLLSIMIDRAYQRADQKYRNAAKASAFLAAFILAEIAGASLYYGTPGEHTALAFLSSPTFYYALIASLLATPIAPVAKDLASGINTAMKAVQAIKVMS